jgi:hypothetical protein
LEEVQSKTDTRPFRLFQIQNYKRGRDIKLSDLAFLYQILLSDLLVMFSCGRAIIIFFHMSL